jgi:hypothetical protein
MAKAVDPIPVSELRKLYSYDPDTGQLTRLTSRRKEFIGVVTNDSVRLGEHEISVNRVAWTLYYGYWPSNYIDHINRDRKDNSINNLREASPSENGYNSVQVNSHGYKGVTWRDRKNKPWLAKIRVSGKRINLGSFETKEAAAQAYEEACIKYHGRFAQLGVK